MAYQKELLELDASLKVFNVPCFGLASLIENHHYQEKDPEVEKALDKYLEPLIKEDIDTLISGCTHYPLFADIFKAELKENAEIINTGAIIANELENMLGSEVICNNLNNPSNFSLNVGNSKIFLTDTECNFISVAEKLLEEKSIIINKI